MMDRVNEELQLYERVPDAHTKHARGFNFSKHVSIQDRVNADPVFESTYMDHLHDTGWKILENNSDIFKEELKGRHFKYRLNGKSLSRAEKGTFRSGGMMIGRKNAEDYVLYKSYTGAIFPLQLSDIEVVYVKDPNVKIKGKNGEKTITKTVFFAEPKSATAYPVGLRSPLTGEDVIVYYAKDNYSKDRFMMSKKFNYAYETADWEFKLPN
jgi:hypothetical protein